MTDEYIPPDCVDNAANRASGFYDVCQRAELRTSFYFPNGRALDETKLRVFKFEEDANGSNFDRQQKGSGTKDYEDIANRSDVGQRWLGDYRWPEADRDKVLWVEDNALCFGLFESDEPSTVRIAGEIPPGETEAAHPYTDPRKPRVDLPGDPDDDVCDYTKKLHCAWTDTFAATDFGRDTGNYTKVPDPTSPRLEVRYGVLQITIDGTGMHPASSARLSCWYMPSVDPAAPDQLVRKVDPANPADGPKDYVYYEGNGLIEVDSPEVQPGALGGDGTPVGAHNDPGGRALMKPLDTLNPFDSSPPAVFSEMGLPDLLEAEHTYTYWWSPNHAPRMYIDGIECIGAVTESRFIQRVASYMVLAREINSGIREQDGTPAPIPGYRPKDVGIWGTVCNPRAFPFDVAKVRNIRWYQDPDHDAPLAADGTQPDPLANWLSPNARMNIDPVTPTVPRNNITNGAVTMADRLLDTELGPNRPGGHGVVKAKMNALIDEHNTLQGQVASDVAVLRWVQGNTRDRVEAVIAGRPRTLVLRTGGSPSVDPTGSQGAANWRVEEDFNLLVPGLGRYLGVGTLAYFNGLTYELLTSYSSDPTGVTNDQWRVVGGSGSDGAVPPTPTNLAVSNITANSVRLTWTRPDETNIARYVLHKQELPDGTPELASMVGLTFSYTYTGLTESTQYRLEVRGQSQPGVNGLPAAITVTTTASTETTGSTNQPTKVRVATESAEPAKIKVYINGTTAQYVVRINGANPVTVSGGYYEDNTQTPGQQITVSAQGRSPSGALSDPTSATATPGVETDGEATAGRS